MTSKSGPNKRFKTNGNQTIQNLKNFNDPLTIRKYVHEHGAIEIEGQEPKEFRWLFTKWAETVDTPSNEKWIKKLQNWTRAHPDLAIDYLLTASKANARAIGREDKEMVKNILFFFIKRMKVEHLIHRPSFQHKINTES